ncbi:DNA internalization-related competence protein ComEC/Rec2 [Alkalicoccus daliensis]|uniref:Competence protein ComEC n=1 Tax=Alkalicoccus daliensis TaxID=745820 RepID=A0A1H0BFF7_9BACI|nr:DNA internalization-related competence protein ComEC/Rec2 [Alkalicoccus daliensis]SDN44123.1 competence protein ComEC [Alkalicoccus daliensis]
MYSFFYLFSGTILGIVLYISYNPEGRLTGIALLFIFMCFSRKKSFLLAGLIFGFGAALFTAADMEAVEPEKNLSVAGQVVTVPVPAGSQNNVSYTFNTATSGKLRVYSEAIPEAGSECILHGEIAVPAAVKSPYQFDYKNYLDTLGIAGQFFAKEVNCNNNTSMFYKSLDKRHHIIKKVNEEESEIRALFTALVFGERAYIAEERITLYQRLGVIHLLAVSGLHVGLLSGALWYLLVRIGLTKQQAAAAVILCMPVYIVLAGAGPSVIRSGSMMILGLTLYLFKQRPPLIEVCSIIGTGVLLWNPLMLFHVGFQLSFLTSIVLILSAPLLREGGFLILKVTFTAQLASLPLILFYFYEISFLTLIANTFFIPFVTFIMLPSAFVFMILFQIHPASAEFIEKTVQFFLIPAHALLEWMDSFSGHMINTGAVHPLAAVVLAAAAAVLFLCWEIRKYRYSAAVFLVFCLLGTATSLKLDKYGYVHFLDVGQGDTTIIEMPYKQNIYMIDTGGEVRFTEGELEVSDNGPGKRTILPFLKGKGITEINIVVITHGHADHMGELCYLTDHITIGQVLLPINISQSDFLQEQLSCLENNRVPVKYVQEGDRWIDGENIFQVIHPHPDLIYSENDQSVVINAEIEGVKFLFTGDIEEEAEKDIVKQGGNLAADILKVAHHGSATSSYEEFLAEAAPEAAIIQVGENNRYGHPSAEVLHALESVQVYRTDLHGTISVKVLEGKWEVLPFIREQDVR